MKFYPKPKILCPGAVHYQQYLPDLEIGKSASFAVRFAATARGTLTAQPGRAYEYYSAANATAIPPAKFEVK